jgi:hypothetical protein
MHKKGRPSQAVLLFNKVNYLAKEIRFGEPHPYAVVKMTNLFYICNAKLNKFFQIEKDFVWYFL